MSYQDGFRVPVEGQSLALMHLMAEKGLVKLSEDRNLSESVGNVEISADPADTRITLFFNPGEGVNFPTHFSPKPSSGDDESEDPEDDIIEEDSPISDQG